MKIVEVKFQLRHTKGITSKISLDVDNLISIISSWKKELAMQQNLILKLNSLKKRIITFQKKNITLIL